MKRETTEYEKRLMKELGFHNLKDLEDFLNLPVVDNLAMRVPEESLPDPREYQPPPV
jgi:hypothetical protein